MRVAQLRPLTWLVIASSVALSINAMSCQSKSGATASQAQQQPIEVIDWHFEGPAFFTTGSGGASIYATHGGPLYLDSWDWAGRSMRRAAHVRLRGGVLFASWTTAGALYGSYRNNDPSALVLSDPDTNVVRDIIPAEAGWSISRIGVSRNGRYAGISFSEDVMSETIVKGHPKLRVVVFNITEKQISGSVMLIGEKSNETGIIYDCLPSDNGQFVAIASYANQVAVVDVQSNKLLWKSLPAEESSITCAAFAPDSKIVYAGGWSSKLFAFDTLTGKYLWGWFATPTGSHHEECHISGIATSGNGGWVAAAMSGWAYVGSVQKQCVVAAVNHGSMALDELQFSPDSSAMATFGGQQLKIWSTAGWPGGSAISQSAVSAPAASEPAASDPVSQ